MQINLKKRQRGSYTVETAFLSGILLLVLFAVLLLFLGTMEKGKLSANAYVHVVAEATRMEAGRDSVTMDFQSEQNIAFGNLSWTISGKAKRKIIKPVLFIEKVRMLNAWKGE